MQKLTIIYKQYTMLFFALIYGSVQEIKSSKENSLCIYNISDFIFFTCSLIQTSIME